MPSALCCSVTRVAPLLEHFLGLDCLFHRTCASFPVNSASNPDHELFSPRRLSSCSLDGSCSAALFRASLLRFSFPALLVSAILARGLPQPFLAVPVPIVMASIRLGCQFVISLALVALPSLLRLRLVFASVPVSWPAHLYSCFSSLMFVRTPNSDLLHGLSLELSWRVPLAALFPVCLRVLSWTSAGPSPFRPI